MRRKGDVGLERSRGVDEAERVPPAEAVARDGQLGVVEAGLDELDSRVDDGVGHVRAVRRQEGCTVEGRVVEIGGRGLAVEHVGCDCQVARSGKGVGQSGVKVSDASMPSSKKIFVSEG